MVMNIQNEICYIIKQLKIVNAIICTNKRYDYFDLVVAFKPSDVSINGYSENFLPIIFFVKLDFIFEDFIRILPNIAHFYRSSFLL